MNMYCYKCFQCQDVDVIKKGYSMNIITCVSCLSEVLMISRCYGNKRESYSLPFRGFKATIYLLPAFLAFTLCRLFFRKF